MRLIAFATALVVAAAVNVGARGGQASGSFTTYVGDQVVATEEYSLTPAPDGTLRAEGEVAPAGGAKQKLVTIAARTGPISFAVEVGAQKIYEARFGAGVVKIRPAGRPESELQTKGDVVLENLVWHQFHFLLARYDHRKGGRQTFTFFSPSNERDFRLEIERTGTPAFAVAGEPLKTETYRMTAAGLHIEMWADERHTPLFFRVAAQQLKAVRRGAEELEKLALADAPAPPQLPARSSKTSPPGSGGTKPRPKKPRDRRAPIVL